MPAFVNVPAVVVRVSEPLAGTTTVYHTSLLPLPQVGAATPEPVAPFTVPAVFTQLAFTGKAVAPHGLSFAGCAKETMPTSSTVQTAISLRLALAERMGRSEFVKCMAAIICCICLGSFPSTVRDGMRSRRPWRHRISRCRVPDRRYPRKRGRRSGPEGEADHLPRWCGRTCSM